MESKPSDLIAKRARGFRRALTEPEAMLWSRLKGRSGAKPVFRRQFPYESMIFDFYCPAARLAVEVDGSTHWSEAQRAKDRARDAWLAARGITVARIEARAIYEDLGGIAQSVIVQAEDLIRRRQAGPAARPLHPPLYSSPDASFGGRSPSPAEGGKGRTPPPPTKPRLMR